MLALNDERELLGLRQVEVVPTDDRVVGGVAEVPREDALIRRAREREAREATAAVDVLQLDPELELLRSGESDRDREPTRAARTAGLGENPVETVEVETVLGKVDELDRLAVEGRLGPRQPEERVKDARERRRVRVDGEVPDKSQRRRA